MESQIPFVGHTEEIYRYFNKEGMMCMYHPQLSIIPLTNHIPLKEVPGAIENLDTETLYQSMRFFNLLFHPDKGSAWCGLNPHAGEGGKIGVEEGKIREYIEIGKNYHLDIEGPLSADGLFSVQSRNRYSLIIANYHDQALIPFKAIFGAEGLNITLNMPILRVSPDHGPAYSITGTQEADISSVYNSLLFADQWGKKWIKQYSCL